ncbi:hypothetical protein SSX86_006820 [Deinandra increscens subsp. villosa]|uniref:Nucleotide-binding alpha-beta plait domain-containing protein n=1 Tax=Deinandra increscens subsp. villosa TaxID=3103831 RepID=A0AAP0DJP0_9ASTR
MDRCSIAGKVVDVFISDKTSSAGKRFAFVRFSKGSDLSNIIYKIRNIWIGSFRLFADVTKFKRGDNEGVKNDSMVKGNKDGNAVDVNASKDAGAAKPVSWADSRLGNQEVKAAWGNKGVIGGSDQGAKEGMSKFHDEVLGGVNGLRGAAKGGINGSMEKFVVGKGKQVVIDNFKSSLLLKVRDVKSMAKLYHLASQEGFDKVTFRYIGGWWVRVDCNSIEDSNKFANCKSLKSIFSECKRVTGDFVVKDRMV